MKHFLHNRLFVEESSSIPNITTSDAEWNSVCFSKSLNVIYDPTFTDVRIYDHDWNFLYDFASLNVSPLRIGPYSGITFDISIVADSTLIVWKTFQNFFIVNKWLDIINQKLVGSPSKIPPLVRDNVFEMGRTFFEYTQFVGDPRLGVINSLEFEPEKVRFDKKLVTSDFMRSIDFPKEFSKVKVFKKIVHNQGMVLYCPDPSNSFGNVRYLFLIFDKNFKYQAQHIVEGIQELIPEYSKIWTDFLVLVYNVANLSEITKSPNELDLMIQVRDLNTFQTRHTTKLTVEDSRCAPFVTPEAGPCLFGKFLLFFTKNGSVTFHIETGAIYQDHLGDHETVALNDNGFVYYDKETQRYVRIEPHKTKVTRIPRSRVLDVFFVFK